MTKFNRRVLPTIVKYRGLVFTKCEELTDKHNEKIPFEHKGLILMKVFPDHQPNKPIECIFSPKKE